MEKMEIDDEKNSKENKCTAVLATLEDIPEINNIIISFWGKNSIIIFISESLSII